MNYDLGRLVKNVFLDKREPISLSIFKHTTFYWTYIYHNIIETQNWCNSTYKQHIRGLIVNGHWLFIISISISEGKKCVSSKAVSHVWV